MDQRTLDNWNKSGATKQYYHNRGFGSTIVRHIFGLTVLCSMTTEITFKQVKAQNLLSDKFSSTFAQTTLNGFPIEN